MSMLFVQLTVILGVATIISLIMKRLNQPLIIGYIVTGIIVGPAAFSIVHSTEAIESFGKIGIALLLFLVGLRLRPQMIRDVGAISLITGLGQITITTIVGYALATWLGFEPVVALYLSVAFTFSSTIVILQLLYTKEEQDTLYGRIATGFMLVQDIVAMVIFLFLSSTTTGGDLTSFLTEVLTKATIIIFSVYILTLYIIPKIDRYFAESHQVLFLFALSVCFIFATAFAFAGFSFELGALLAGLLLSVSPYQREIASKIHTLRDFFLVMFFVVLGTQVAPETLVGNWGWILSFSVFILVGNPLIVMTIMRPFGYTLRTSFYCGLTVAQISEFSLILLASGVTFGHIPSTIIGPATMVGLITIFFSSYFVMNNKQLYIWLEPIFLRIFGKPTAYEPSDNKNKVEAILFGCHRLGSGLVDVLESMKLDFVVVDHNPEIVRILQSGGVPGVFGSAEDISFLESLPVRSAKLIVSTIPEARVNLTLTSFVRERNKNAIIICVAYHTSHAEELYAVGASYVVIPPYLGRRYLMDLLNSHQVDRSGYKVEREKHRKDLGYLKEEIETPM